MPYIAPPDKDEISATPSPSNAVAKAGFGKVWDFITGLLGLTGNPEEAHALLKTLPPDAIWNLAPEFSLPGGNVLRCTLKSRSAASLSAANPGFIGQRHNTAGNGTFNWRKIAAGLAGDITSGSTLGATSGVPHWKYWYVIDNAGLQELAWSGKFFGPAGVASTTQDTAGGADSGTVMYSANARANVSFRCIARTRDTQAVAGTYAALPSLVEHWPFHPEDDSANVQLRLAPMGIQGLVPANNAVDALKDIDISPGIARDDADSVDMVLASAITKRLDAAWAVGNNAGGLSTGVAAADTWYYLWLIKRMDTGVVDVMFDPSITVPTMPAGYGKRRPIGAVKTDGSINILAFVALETHGGGIEHWWKTPILDVNSVGAHAATLRTMSVPPGIRAKLTGIAGITSTNTADNISALYISDPLTNDVAPTVAGAAMASFRSSNSAPRDAAQFQVWTNTSAQVRSRADGPGAASFFVSTSGFEWSRR